MENSSGDFWGMKRYEFTLTKKEAWELAVRIVWEQKKFWAGKMAFLIFLLAVNIWLTPRLGAFLLTFLAVIWGGMVVSLYKRIKKEQCEKGRTVWLEAGKLKMEYGEYAEAPLTCIQVIRVTRRLLMLGRYQAKKQFAWYAVPLRVFESIQERDSFIARIRNAEESGPQDLQFQREQALFRFSFWLDEPAWLTVMEEVMSTQLTGALDSGRNWKWYKVFLAGYGAFCVAFGTFWFVFDRGRMGLSVLFVLTFLYIALLKNRLESPKERSRKLLKRGQLQNNVYGDCELVILEKCVIQQKDRQEAALYHWDSLGWVVETEHAFCLVKKDRRVFLLTLKSSIWNREQAEAFLATCERKGLTYVWGRTQKLLPGWFFRVLSGVCIAVYLMAMFLVAVRDGRRTAARWEAEETYAVREQAKEFQPDETLLEKAKGGGRN